MNRENALDEIENHYRELEDILDFEEYDTQKEIPFLNNLQEKTFTKYRKIVTRNDNNQEIEKIAYVLNGDDKYFVFYTEKNNNDVSIELVGGSHHSSESVKNIEEKFNQNKYDKCMVELDKNRADAIRNNDISFSFSDSFRVLFNFFGDFSIRGAILGLLYLAVLPLVLILVLISRVLGIISKIRGREEGKEFKRAMELCENSDTNLILIDRKINEVIGDYISETSKKEFLKLIFILIYAKIFVAFSGGKSMDSILEKSKKTKKENPKLYKHFIEHRNNYMIGEIVENIDSSDEKIIIIVGAGHVNGLEKLLEEQNFEDVNITISEEVL